MELEACQQKITLLLLLNNEKEVCSTVTSEQLSGVTYITLNLSIFDNFEC